MRSGRLAWLVLGGLVACAPARSAPPPTPAPPPGSVSQEPPGTHPALPADHPRPVAPADAAFASGWMPLAATGVPAFRAAHPEADGRGVVLAILDSGIDAGAAGLATTPTGDRKILDLRDFSGEGRVALSRLTPEGDTVAVAGLRLGGVSRIRALAVEGPLFGGVLEEWRLGRLPAADLNGDGDDADTLPVLVARASDGWFVMADTDGDGSVADEQPVRDYALGKSTLGWHRPGDPPPANLAVNLSSDSAGLPVLDLLFDTSGHGTHVAGVAAGHGLHGVEGFDGVAPGAQLLGLKISNNAHGGISVTGSMLRALDHAIRFAAVRRRPLVVNLSFGVGNEVEGTARIDRLLDSVLAAHPSVLLVTSAGNDGPGLSTMGFPATADRVLTVGATLPLVFVERPAGRGEAGEPDPVAYFSARGGDAPKPDVLAPGVAYSAVPRWRVGEERSVGTSMASPHVAGLAALLLSALPPDSALAVPARALKQALMVTARPTPGATYLDEGTGVPDLPAAYAWLGRGHAVPDIVVRTPAGHSAAWRPGGLPPGDAIQEFRLVRPAGSGPARYRLTSDVPWLVPPSEVRMTGPETRVLLTVRTSAVPRHGVQVGVVSGWGPDPEAGPAFRLVNAIAWPLESDGIGEAVRLPAGGTGRLFVPVDSGQAFELVVRSARRFQTVLTSLHEPGGRPYRGENGLPAGFGDAAAVYHVDGRQARPGLWELAIVASPTEPGAAVPEVTRAPLRLAARRDPQGLEVRATNLTGREVPVSVGAALIGGERGALVTGRGSAPVDVTFVVPPWARAAEVDVDMAPEQWSRFTDFGFSLLEADGRLREKAPLDYAAGRLGTEFSERDTGRTLRVALLPAFADPEPQGAWAVRLAIRLYADSAMTLATAEGAGAHGLLLAPRADAAARFVMPDSPWALGDGFFPLGMLFAETEGKVWTREVGLPAPIPPPMRNP